MSETTPAATTAATTDAAPAAPEAALTDTSVQPEGEQTPATDWEKVAKEVRDEAARHRTQKQEARRERDALQAQLDEATPQLTAYSELQDAHETTTTELNQIKAALAAGFPVDTVLSMAPRLRGSTPEELAEDAKALKTQLGAVAPAQPARPRPDPSQGSPAKPALTGLAGVLANTRKTR